MSPRDLASLAFKLAGVYSIVQALIVVTSLLAMVPIYSSGSFNDSLGETAGNVTMLVAGSVIGIVLLGGFGMFLIGASRRLAETTVLEDTVEKGLRSIDVHSVLFSVLGAFFVARVAADLPGLIQTVHTYRGTDYPDQRAQLLQQTWPWAAGILLQLIIGLVLLLKSRRVALVFNPSEATAQTERPSLRCPSCDHPYNAEDYRADADGRVCSKCGSDLDERG